MKVRQDRLPAVLRRRPVRRRHAYRPEYQAVPVAGGVRQVRRLRKPADNTRLGSISADFRAATSAPLCPD